MQKCEVIEIIDIMRKLKLIRYNMVKSTYFL